MRFEWMSRGLCRGATDDLFFPGRGEAEKERQAKAVCARCPVLEDFLGERDGIWGGMNGRERQRERKRRMLARRDAA